MSVLKLLKQSMAQIVTTADHEQGSLVGTNIGGYGPGAMDHSFSFLPLPWKDQVRGSRY